MNWIRIAAILLIGAIGLPEVAQAQYPEQMSLELIRRGQTRYVRSPDGSYVEVDGKRGYHIVTHCGLKAGPEGPSRIWNEALDDPKAGGTIGHGVIDSEDACHARMGKQKPDASRAGQVLRGDSGDWNFFVDKRGVKWAIPPGFQWKDCVLGQVKSQMVPFDTIWRIQSSPQLLDDSGKCNALAAEAGIGPTRERKEIDAIRQGSGKSFDQTKAMYANAERFGAISSEERAQVDALFAKIAATLKSMDAFAASKSEADELRAAQAFQTQANEARALVTTVSAGAEALAACRNANLQKFDTAKRAYDAGVQSKKIKPLEMAAISAKQSHIVRLQADKGGRDMNQCTTYSRGIDDYAAAVTRAAAN